MNIHSKGPPELSSDPHKKLSKESFNHDTYIVWDQLYLYFLRRNLYIYTLPYAKLCG